MTQNELMAVREQLDKISMDFDNNQVMVKSDFKIVDFDKAKEIYARRFGGYSPKSCDGLYYSDDEDTFYLVEFKNGKISGEVKTQIYFKILESLSLLSDVLDRPTSYFRARCKFILVYNDSKNRSAIGSHVVRNAGGEIVRFGLDRFERIYVRKVHTLNSHEFYMRFVRRWESKN